MNAYVVILLAVLLVPAAVIDYRQHRIPNWLSLSGWVLGCAAGFAGGGTAGLQTAVLGLAIMLAAMLPFYVLGWMGAGDAKLMAAVGAVVGSGWVLPVLAAVVVAGAVMAVAVLARSGRLRSAFDRFRAMVGMSIAAARPTYIGPSRGETGLVLPYGVPIAVGTLAVACVQLLR
jgi:prepilin peptidase CpaA